MKSKDGIFPFSMYKESADGRVINTRFHRNSMEIAEVTSGDAVVQIGTEFISARAGDIFCVPPGLMFRVESVGGAATVRGMIFDTSIIEANMDNFDSEILYMFYVQSRNRVAVFDESHPAHASLAKLMDESYDEYRAKDVCYKLPIRANIYLMMTAMLRHYCGSKDESDRMVYHNVLRLRPVIEYVSEHFREKIYIDKLAEMIGVSADYFTKMFKESIGKTPVDYINGMRVNHSMYLLCSGELTMAEIADNIGFCNPNYFHKIFKQYMDVSPLSYRKNAK